MVTASRLLLSIIMSLLLAFSAFAQQINTEVGSNITVNLGDTILVTFDSVEVEGFTEFQFVSDGPPMPDDIVTFPVPGSSFYDMFTSAAYTGQIHINFQYNNSALPGYEDKLRMQYFDDGAWVDVTDSVNTDGDMLHGSTESLSTLLFGIGFDCGDSDGSGEIDIDDVVFLISYIFAGGEPPFPVSTGDPDCSGEIDIDDAVYLIARIFGGGPDPCASCSTFIERILIEDIEGIEWDITHALYNYDLDSSTFGAGIGGYSILPINNPEFASGGEPGFPEPSDTFFVIGTTINGESRAYPLYVLRWHEAVNDYFGATPVLVAY